MGLARVDRRDTARKRRQGKSGLSSGRMTRRVGARQARRVRAGHGRVWKVPYWIDQVRQARSV